MSDIHISDPSNNVKDYAVKLTIERKSPVAGLAGSQTVVEADNREVTLEEIIDALREILAGYPEFSDASFNDALTKCSNK